MATGLVIFHHKRYDRCWRDRCPARIRLLHRAGCVTRGGRCRPQSSQGGELKPTDELRAENEALRDRLSQLSESSLRISESLDVNTVLREVVESARALTSAGCSGITTMDAPAADLSQPCAPPVGLSPATRSPGVGSQSCGAKYPGFCADSKGV